MKPKLLIGILIVLIVLNVATIGSFVYTRWQMSERDRDFPLPGAPKDFSDAGRRGTPPEPPHPPETPFQLRSEDRTQLRKLLADFYEETADLRSQVRELETEAFSLMELDSVPRSKLDSVLGDLSDIRLEMRRLAVDNLIESKDFLTEQQQKHFFRAILETGTHRSMRMGRHPMYRRGEGRRGGRQ